MITNAMCVDLIVVLLLLLYRVVESGCVVDGVCRWAFYTNWPSCYVLSG